MNAPYLPCISACREKIAMGQRVGRCYTCVEELRLSARIAIDAGERMIATLTKERDEVVDLLRRIVVRDGLNDNQWFWLHDCKELLARIDGDPAQAVKPPPSADAVDPHVADPGTLTTRENT